MANRGPANHHLHLADQFDYPFPPRFPLPARLDCLRCRASCCRRSLLLPRPLLPLTPCLILALGLLGPAAGLGGPLGLIGSAASIGSPLGLIGSATFLASR